MVAARSLASLRFRAKAVVLLAWAYIVLMVLQIALVGYLQFRPQEIVVNAPGTDPGLAPQMLLGIASFAGALLLLLITVALIVMALMWIYRAHANLVQQGVAIDHSPGWAVGSYFIPFVNLVIPFRAMRELYNRSHGEIEEHAHSTVDDVMAWWTAYILGIGLTLLLFGKYLFDLLTNVVFLTPPWMEFAMSSFASLLLAVSCFLLAKLVKAITAAQAESAFVSSAFE